MIIPGLVLFYLFFPLLILYACHRFPYVNKVGAVVIAYVVGFIIGNTGLLPRMEGSAEVLDMLTMLTVPIAIPLLLFSANARNLKGLAGKAMLSMLFALVAVTITVFAGYFIFRGEGITGMPHVSAMMVGLYTGSTPNLAAIKIALNADETTYIIIATYDLVVGAVHLLFVMTIAQRLFLKYLRPYRFIDPVSGRLGKFDGEDPYWGLLNKRRALPLLKAFGIAVLIFGIGGSATLILPESSQMAVVILIITTLGIAASFIPAVNRIEKSFELGMYLIMIFCMVIASLADLSKIDFVAMMIAAYVALVVFGSMLIQSLLSRIFKVDADTFLITSTAFICNPAIVPVVAGSIKNRELIFPGITVGVFGMAIGNYLGILMAWVLERI